MYNETMSSFRPAKALPHNDPFDRVMLAKKNIIAKILAIL